jgi:16S rRNA (guanine527-N7)-methyltransferase
MEEEIQLIQALLNCTYLDNRVPISPPQAAQLAALSAATEQAGMNLTAVSGGVETILKHYADSLALAAFPHLLPRDTELRLLDVGSGGGFPGLPLKNALSILDVTLMDSTEKKVNHINRTTQLLHLEGARAVCGRAEELSRPGMPMRERFDRVTARAVARLNVLCELCMPYVKKGGIFAALKGAKAQEELDEAREAIRLTGGRLLSCEKLRFSLGTLAPPLRAISRWRAGSMEAKPRFDVLFRSLPWPCAISRLL